MDTIKRLPLFYSVTFAPSPQVKEGTTVLENDVNYIILKEVSKKLLFLSILFLLLPFLPITVYQNTVGPRLRTHSTKYETRLSTHKNTVFNTKNNCTSCIKIHFGKNHAMSFGLLSGYK